MAQISIHLDGEVKFTKHCGEAVSGGWPLSVDITSHVGLGEFKHVYTRDFVNFHGKVKDFRAFANALLMALPVETDDERATDVEGEI